MNHQVQLGGFHAEWLSFSAYLPVSGWNLRCHKIFSALSSASDVRPTYLLPKEFAV